MKDMYKDRLLELVNMEYHPDKADVLIDYVDELMRMEHQRGMHDGVESVRSMLVESICEAITKI